MASAMDAEAAAKMTASRLAIIPRPNEQSGFKNQQRCNDTHESTTDADARLYKKAPGDKSRLCHMGHIFMENRNGLVVDVQITHASGSAEREAALAMLERWDNKHKRATLRRRQRL